MTQQVQHQDFTTTLLVNKSPGEVFSAVNNVRGWWSQNITGVTDRPQGEFIYNYKDLHYSKMKLVEFVPDKRVVWLVAESRMNFLKNKDEWTNTRVVFEITRKGKQTQLVFTHVGLRPEVECYELCLPAWTDYVQRSLLQLITTGKGKPNPKEG